MVAEGVRVWEKVWVMCEQERRSPVFQEAVGGRGWGMRLQGLVGSLRGPFPPPATDEFPCQPPPCAPASFQIPKFIVSVHGGEMTRKK